MAIEHDFFGLLETRPDGSVSWAEDIDLGDMRVEVELSAPDEDDVTLDALDAGASFVNGLEELDSRARNAMLGEVDNRASDVAEFVVAIVEKYGDDLEDLLVDVSGDAPVDVIRTLSLTTVLIVAEEHGTSEPFALFEYVFDPEGDVGAGLVVGFASDGTVMSVRGD